MGEVIAFPAAAVFETALDEPEVDLITAVDAAIRDLRDIADASLEDGVRQLAEECRSMLERAFRANIA